MLNFNTVLICFIYPYRDTCPSESTKTCEDQESSVNDHNQDEVLAEKQGAQPPEGSEKPEDPKWSHEAVLLLISLKTEFSGMFSSNIITQKQAWKRISEEICNKGYHFSGDVCDRKFRSLKMRYKIIKERNNKTGNSRQSWQYFDEMDKMLHGDPAVQPVTVASSLTMAASTSSTTPMPQKPTPKKRKNDKEPAWMENYRGELKKMHQERIELDKERLNLEERRVQALERLADAFNK
ncbi:uncharacterized protein [Magallana gigas]|uniref:uncharacterized protein n=1 Tax=Magallana gigas TaxID=29159 RepID=UPI00334067BA